MNISAFWGRLIEPQAAYCRELARQMEVAEQVNAEDLEIEKAWRREFQRRKREVGAEIERTLPISQLRLARLARIAFERVIVEELRFYGEVKLFFPQTDQGWRAECLLRCGKAIEVLLYDLRIDRDPFIAIRTRGIHLATIYLATDQKSAKTLRQFRLYFRGAISGIVLCELSRLIRPEHPQG